MTPKDNAYAVLALCEANSKFSQLHMDTSFAGHVFAHMSDMDPQWVNLRVDEWPGKKAIEAHVGFSEVEWQFWKIECDYERSNDWALNQIAKLIQQVHGGSPERLRLF